MFDLIRRIGSKIEILSRTGVRYTGALSSYDAVKETITLAKVRSFGTENRQAPVKMQASTQVYEYIVFKLVNVQGIKHNSSWISIATEEIITPSVVEEKKKSTGNISANTLKNKVNVRDATGNASTGGTVADSTRIKNVSTIGNSIPANNRDEKSRHGSIKNILTIGDSILTNLNSTRVSSGTEDTRVNDNIEDASTSGGNATVNSTSASSTPSRSSGNKPYYRSKYSSKKDGTYPPKYTKYNPCLRKNTPIPEAEYDFALNNKEMPKDKNNSTFKNNYDPSFFYDSLS
ncbi:hypothetical protein NEMIN01_1141 [Nematocida minor]|uniref:uncharacterized protein n=1 Tax=Nematocida minor TaxID=1912983 RepID=UPI00221F4B5B|nr:uncharacterized protein NEMIN01_1141 [Nematocida minor]KAI5190676.1 hypothetical protein NEMIN01_1141 [Nematocida minor]